MFHEARTGEPSDTQSYIDVDSITRPGNKASILPTVTTDELYTSYN